MRGGWVYPLQRGGNSPDRPGSNSGFWQLPSTVLELSSVRRNLSRDH